MQTVQFIPCENFAAGTSLQGKIFASYQELVDMFGAPHFEGIGDKTTTEWTIDYQVSDDNGESLYGTFTLYDWHFARNLNDNYEVTQWNVGGNSYQDAEAADLAKRIFDNQEDNESLVYAKLHELVGGDQFLL